MFVESAMVGNLNFEPKARTAIMGWRCKSESHWLIGSREVCKILQFEQSQGRRQQDSILGKSITTEPSWFSVSFFLAGVPHFVFQGSLPSQTRVNMEQSKHILVVPFLLARLRQGRTNETKSNWMKASGKYYSFL